MRFKYSLLTILPIVAILFFSRCARIVAPTGGQKDTIAPIPILYSPANNLSDFDAKKINVTFDEFFSLQNVKQNLLVSPPLNKKPEIKQRSKKLIIDLKDCELKENTTYTISLSNSIADITEKNVVSNFNYSFSTGQSVDSLQVKGTIINAETKLPEKDVFVLLHSNLSDTAFSTTFPDFFAKTNEHGQFFIQNVKKANYKIYALKDQNNDLIYNQENEEVGFLDEIITPEVHIEKYNDTIFLDTINGVIDSTGKFDLVEKSRTIFTPDSLRFSLFKESPKNQFLKSYNRTQRNLLILKFNIPLIKDSLIVRTIDDSNFADKIFISNIENNDSLYVWLKDENLFQNDSLKFILEYYKTINNKYEWTIDTILPKYSTRNDKNNGLIVCKINHNLKDKQSIKPSDIPTFSINNPITQIDKSRIHLYRTVDTLSMQKSDGSFYPTDTAGMEFCTSQVAPKVNKYRFVGKGKQPFIRSYKYGNGKFATCFNDSINAKGIKISSIDFENLQNFYISEFDTESNCLLCWITDENIQRLRQPQFKLQHADSIANLPLKFDEDETKNFRSPHVSKMKLYINEVQEKSIKLDEMLEIICSNPIQSIDTSKISIRMTTDSLQTKLKFDYTQPSLRRILFSHQWLLGKRYSITFERGAITDIFGQISKEWDATLLAQSRTYNQILFDVPFELEADTTRPQAYKIITKLDSKQKYRITFDEGFATDIFGYQTDTSMINFSTIDQENLGTINLTICNLQSPIVLQLWDKDLKKMEKEVRTNKNETIEITDLTPMEYYVKVIFDDNNNGKYDSGNVKDKIKPEEIGFTKDLIKTKANWLTKYTLDINNLNLQR